MSRRRRGRDGGEWEGVRDRQRDRERDRRRHGGRLGGGPQRNGQTVPVYAIHANYKPTPKEFCERSQCSQLSGVFRMMPFGNMRTFQCEETGLKVSPGSSNENSLWQEGRLRAVSYLHALGSDQSCVPSRCRSSPTKACNQAPCTCQKFTHTYGHQNGAARNYNRDKKL